MRRCDSNYLEEIKLCIVLHVAMVLDQEIVFAGPCRCFACLLACVYLSPWVVVGTVADRFVQVVGFRCVLLACTVQSPYKGSGRTGDSYTLMEQIPL